MNPVPSIPRSRKSRKVDVVAHWWRCGASLVTEVLGSNPASPTMILMRCRIISHNVENVERPTVPLRREAKKDQTFLKMFFFILFVTGGQRKPTVPLRREAKKDRKYLKV